jgi:hypothetical protein
MSIFDKKQELSSRGPKGMPEKVTPSSREEKKDTSIFGGKSHMDKGSFMRRLKEDQRLFKSTGLGEKERTKLGEKLFGSSGSYLDPGEIKEAKKQLGLGRYGKFKDFSLSEREDAKKLIKEISGE